MTLNLAKTKLDLTKVDEGTIWKIEALPDGSLNGTRVDSIPEKDAWVCVIPPNIAYRRAHAAAQRPYLKQIREGTISDDVEARINGMALVELVKDWGNITDGTKLLECSLENKTELLTKREWSNFAGLIDSIANTRAALLEEDLEEAEGNSSADLSGTSTNSTLVGDKNSSNSLPNEGKNEDTLLQTD